MLNRLVWHLSVFVARWRTRLGYLVRLPRTYRNCWAVVFPKIGLDTVLELRNGTRYFVRSGTTDLAVVNEASISNPYLRSPLISVGDHGVVIDGGANIGDFTVEAAVRCPKGAVLAVEPIAEHVRMIDIQIQLNKLSNVRLVQAALGPAPGFAEMHVAGSASRIRESDDSSHRVRVFTLAELMTEHKLARVDLLKLDCEGAEWETIVAAEEVLPRIDQICMEFHRQNGWTPERLAEWLRARCYTVSHTAGSWNGLLWARRRA